MRALQADHFGTAKAEANREVTEAILGHVLSQMLRIVQGLLFSLHGQALNLTLCFCRKPRNARSKRALDAREAKEIEDPRTAIFVRGAHTGDKVNKVMKDLVSVSLPS